MIPVFTGELSYLVDLAHDAYSCARSVMLTGITDICLHGLLEGSLRFGIATMWRGSAASMLSVHVRST